MDEITNLIFLRGTLAGRPAFSHTARGETFWGFPLEVRRLSGTSDVVNVIAKRALLDAAEPGEGDKVCVTGEVRSFNNKSGVGSRLVITVYAKELTFARGPDANTVTLRGTLCRRPNLRCTPMGRVICDMMTAVNRRYGRSDYLPCIAWGRLAEEADNWDTGTKVLLTGRLQSRTYTKLLEEGPVERVAYEISLSSGEIIPAPDGEFRGSPAY